MLLTDRLAFIFADNNQNVAKPSCTIVEDIETLQEEAKQHTLYAKYM